MNQRAVRLVILALSVFIVTGCSSSRTPLAPAETAVPLPAPPREFRAAWIATVANIDWPSEPGLSTSRQQAELRALLDRAVDLNLNAVILQVRPAADAFYASPFEPWSPFLSGSMGRAPAPYYDPLAFAVEEAHKRGLELHAWFNPYRAYHPSSPSDVSDDHVSVKNPTFVRRYGDYLWLDPGEPGARALTRNVILDVVERYDVDGVHFDDYFYPYPSYAQGADFPDSMTWNRALEQGTTTDRDDWRRGNVDLLIEELYRDIKQRKPHVKFGISPFGIWRPGHPEGTSGFDAYAQLYADSRKWLREGWVDYFTPQIYYRIAQHAQPYPLMLRWWLEQNIHDRHIWPGNYTGRVGSDGGWPLEEIPGQIYVTRGQPGASGNVHFSMRVFMQDPDSLVEELIRTTYADDALVPASSWLDDEPPARPRASLVRDPVHGGTSLIWSPEDDHDVWLWVVRERPATERDDAEWRTTILPSGRQTLRVGDSVVLVSAVDRTGNEGLPATAAAGSREGLALDVIPHSEWELEPPVGHPADATRRNLVPGQSLRFNDLSLTVLEMMEGEATDFARLALASTGQADTTMVAEGQAFNWNGYRTGVLAVRAGDEELGAGLVELEIAVEASLPDILKESTVAGGTEDRLRIPHEIDKITLHHSGSPEPLLPSDDPVEKLRGLQIWGREDRNWWDVPYHFLIDLDGRVYEGRDYRYMGETNTTYDPEGHLLVSVLGNYDEQEPTPTQIEAITRLMAWAVVEFDVSLDDVGGHRDWADTACPGRHLSRYFDDDTFVSGIEELLDDLSTRRP